MKKYKIYTILNNDYAFMDNFFMNTKGSRVKRVALEIENMALVYFKYEKYNCSEACSEKISYEIAKILDYPCARIEFAIDDKGNIGILNYLFTDTRLSEHSDAVSYINKDISKRKEFYTISNIKDKLDQIDEKLFYEFLKIMVFDALVGETDRHEENWGITKIGNEYKISPLYDNGCNLLREFKNEEIASKYYSGEKSFKDYIFRAKSCIYKDDGSGRYKLFDLINYLYDEYPEVIRKELLNLNKLDDEKIEKIVTRIPNGMINDNHKEYIIMYLKERRNILMDILKRRENDNNE